MGIHFKANKEKDKDMSFEPVPEADYLLEVKKVPDHSITKTNRDMLRFELTINDEEYLNRKIWYNLVFIPEFENNEAMKGHGMTVRALKAFGLPYDGDLDIDPSEFLGKIVRAHIKIVKDTYQGKETVKNEIAWFIVDDSESQEQPTQKPSPASTVAVNEEEQVPF